MIKTALIYLGHRADLSHPDGREIPGPEKGYLRQLSSRSLALLSFDPWRGICILYNVNRSTTNCLD